MYSGLLPQGLTEADLSPEDEEEDGVADEKCISKSSLETLSEVEGNSELVVGVDLSSTAATQEKESPTCSLTLPGIPQEMWQRFQELQKKKDEINTTKVPRRRKRRRPKKDNDHGTESKESTEKREREQEQEKRWDGLKQYFSVNDRFQPPSCSRPPPKSGLEKSMESAVAEGDFAGAEEMSDRLATRELAVKIAQAADCRDYVQRKQEEEASRAAQKKKKVAWGFEAKQRWETKSNMGYM